MGSWEEVGRKMRILVARSWTSERKTLVLGRDMCCGGGGREVFFRWDGF
jgi:hypothetical protein